MTPIRGRTLRACIFLIFHHVISTTTGRRNLSRPDVISSERSDEGSFPVRNRFLPKVEIIGKMEDLMGDGRLKIGDGAEKTRKIGEMCSVWC